MNHLIIFVLSSLVFINAQVYEGYTLFTPMSAFDDNATTYLMNNDYEFLNTWTHDQGHVQDKFQGSIWNHYLWQKCSNLY